MAKKPASEKKPAAAAAKSPATPAADPTTTAAGPAMSVERQYVRAMSVESLSGADRVTRTIVKPEIKVGIEVGAIRLTDTDQGERFEVTITAEASAVDEGSGALPLFTVKVAYSGIFILANLSDRQRPVALGIEAPRMLFPFVRHYLADMSRDCGYPPVLLDNVDFASLLRQRIAATAKQQAESGAAKDAANGQANGKSEADPLDYDGDLKFD